MLTGTKAEEPDATFFKQHWLGPEQTACAVIHAGNALGSHGKQMPYETRHALCLLSELVAALRSNAPDTFNQWLAGEAHDLGEHAVAELMHEWMVPLLTQDEADRLVGWNLGVSL